MGISAYSTRHDKKKSNVYRVRKIKAQSVSSIEYIVST